MENGRTLYDKVWDSHTVDILPTGQTQLFVGLHLIHEITTAPAFDMLREKGMDVAFPERTFATVDHIVSHRRPYAAVSSGFPGGGIDAGAGKERRRVRHRFFVLDSDKRASFTSIGPQLVDAAGSDTGLRRQPHQHARRVRALDLRHRHEPGAGRARHATLAMDRSNCGESHRRLAGSRCLRQGVILNHPQARRRGRQGFAYEYTGAR